MRSAPPPSKKTPRSLRPIWLGAVALLASAGAESAAQTFGPPSALNTNAPSDGLDADWYPQVATDGAGNWVAVWQRYLDATAEWDVLVARSTDNGATWTAPAHLKTSGASDASFIPDEFPEVATDGAGTWVAVWQSNDPLGGTYTGDRDILVARSTDNGATWSAPASLSNGASDGTESNPHLATDGAGNWLAVWPSGDCLGGTGCFDIFGARSTDGGATWTAAAQVNPDAPSDPQNDLNPHVTTDGAGNWLAVWLRDPGTGGILVGARSTDNGATWTAPSQMFGSIGQDPTTPRVTADGAGHWVVVWSYRLYPSFEHDLAVSRSADNGVNWSTTTLNTDAASDSETDVYPQVTTDGAGNWLALWQTDPGPRIATARSTDNGASWTAPADLSTPTPPAYSPQLTTDGAGTWVAVWHSYNSLGGTIGGDADILVSTGSICGDGLVGEGEDCDEGGIEGATCDADCTFAACGDGTLNQTAGELCDDGNLVGADGCEPDCLPSLDHFMLYGVRPSLGSQPFQAFGPVELADQFRTASYNVKRPKKLALPADKNMGGINDPVTHLKEYRIAPRVGTPVFAPVPNTHIVNQCEDRLITVGNPFSILVPTNKDLVQTAPPVVQSEHGLDHFLCYKVPLPNALPPGFQVDVTDQFQTRRYDLKKVTKLCVPVAKDVVPGSPPVRLADGSPVTIEPSPIRNPKDHLVCYKAKRSLRLIAQDGCGPAVPGDTGTAIQPPQPPHQRVFGVFLNNQLGEERVDTKPQRFLGQELCIPSAKNPVCGDGVVEPLAGEQCDDGNTLDGDGCSSTCQIEP